MSTGDVEELRVHEYSIVQALLERVESEARARGAVAVHSLSIRIGEASGVEPDLLRSAYDLVREQTLCAAAPLHIRAVPVRWACPACGSRPGDGHRLECPDCGLPVRLVEGDEILLDRIELEVP